MAETHRALGLPRMHLWRHRRAGAGVPPIPKC